jgi:hypothetical protein
LQSAKWLDRRPASSVTMMSQKMRVAPQIQTS